ncbi:LOW QUALITY PROTEIN: hypothetical protein RvY_02440-1 [Ramazzottius varieornatus]|uniref:Uncharacterized protein n=1 Tax=Ramazzottius varieornatus TaxID=947166 RepID=A0A1D1UJR1_RAMVA|nr:LOW QUALITY PROTEIN: hypothetical protein RvY_02440-1 [Ramazzottius varieornatus]
MNPPLFAIILASVLCFTTHIRVVESSPDAERLYTYLMRDYSKLIRPVPTNEEILSVLLSLKFLQLIAVDEVNQVITTNVMVRQTWNDYKLKWDPEEYGGLSTLYIPCEAIWLPDIVLYNNAEGDYQITMMTKVTVNYTGDVVWDPPAIYKSYCLIDVTYFPYDKQSCEMKFGTWTYDAGQVDLTPIRGYETDSKKIQIGMDLSEYKESIEWDILEASAMRNRLVYSYGTYVDITFKLVIRRKTLFYTVNLMIPCILISCLTVFVFYLPSDSGEKVTLCISILLSLTVFILLLAEIIPPTSLTVPLMGRYLLFTLVMTTMSIALTIVIINVHFRNPSTHRMGPWIRKVFLQWLPKLLLMERPKQAQHRLSGESTSSRSGPNGAVNQRDREMVRDRSARNLYSLQSEPQNVAGGTPSRSREKSLMENPEVQNAVRGINFIVEHVRDQHIFGNTVRDWKYVAMVLDRLFLWIFAAVCLIGTGKIVLDAPPLYETDEPIPRECKPPEITDAWICLFKGANDEDYS